MKKMLSRLGLVLLFFTLFTVFTLNLYSCPIGQGDPREVRVHSIRDAEKKLAGHKFSGDSPDDPLILIVNMDLGDLSQPDNKYLQLLDVIGKSGKYVELNLRGCKMGKTTVFTSPPLNKAVKGMDKIVSIRFPVATKSIEADKNGRSPFFFYENLRWVVRDEIGLTKIGDNAFADCKSLEWLVLSSVKTIGNEAFLGCENLKTIRFFYLETIGDKAFFDCSSLEWLSFYTPPLLGNSVFLGSTPGDFTIMRKDEYSDIFVMWLADNASKFHNGGKDIVF